jgi:hypothetical protein
MHPHNDRRIGLDTVSQAGIIGSWSQGAIGKSQNCEAMKKMLAPFCFCLHRRSAVHAASIALVIVFSAFLSTKCFSLDGNGLEIYGLHQGIDASHATTSNGAHDRLALE